tara:strand:- start:66 stop:878 length:813 start_codon:yes stop_codon:yes gene_type:complete
MGYCYLIQQEECLGTDRFKIGCSADEHGDKRRVKKDYGKNVDIIRVYHCDNFREIEKKLKNNFMEHFEKVRGNEYFKGHKDDMSAVFNITTNEIIDLHTNKSILNTFSELIERYEDMKRYYTKTNQNEKLLKHYDNMRDFDYILSEYIRCTSKYSTDYILPNSVPIGTTVWINAGLKSEMSATVTGLSDTCDDKYVRYKIRNDSSNEDSEVRLNGNYPDALSETDTVHKWLLHHQRNIEGLDSWHELIKKKREMEIKKIKENELDDDDWY